MKLDNDSFEIFSNSARDWIADNRSIDHFRKERDTGETVSGRSLWAEMGDMGWPGILIGDECGGLDLGLREMAAVLLESGKQLAATPLLTSGLGAASVLSHCKSHPMAVELLTDIAAGKRTATLAIEEGNHHKPTTPKTSATRSGNALRVQGRKTFVCDAINADFLLVSARVSDESETVLLLLKSDEVDMETLHCIDHRDRANILLDDVTVPVDRILLGGEELIGVLEHTLDLMRIGIAAEMLGMAWACLDMTVDYLKMREQFGRIIGTYQALQHRCAHLFVELHLAKASVDAAIEAHDEGEKHLAPRASQAKALAGEALKHVTNETIQLHGGIGMTDEHNAGLYIKRARVLEQLCGSSDFHRDRYATLHGF